MLAKSSTCEIVTPNNSWKQLPPTRKQLKTIEKMSSDLGEDYITPATRGQAYLMIDDLIEMLSDDYVQEDYFDKEW